jgi:hypothetical protein
LNVSRLTGGKVSLHTQKARSRHAQGRHLRAL